MFTSHQVGSLENSKLTHEFDSFIHCDLDNTVTAWAAIAMISLLAVLVESRQFLGKLYNFALLESLLKNYQRQ